MPVFITLLLISILFTTKAAAAAQQRVLLYSRTQGYRHASIPNAIAALKKLGKQHNFSTYSTEDPEKFEKKNWLNQFDALVFISVSGQALTTKGEMNLIKYIEAGGGYFGIHEACDAMYHMPAYGRLVGAYFDYHPYLQEFTLDVQTHDNPSTSFLNKTWTVTDEVYSFNSNPKKLGKTVVLTADSSSYKDPGGESKKELASEEGAEHPIAWYKEGGLFDQPDTKVANLIAGTVMDTKKTPKYLRASGGDGRAFYTALGHTKACWTEPIFLQHIYGALSWVLASNSIRYNNASLPSTAPGSAPPSSLVASSSNSSSSSSSTGTSSPAEAGSSNIAKTATSVPISNSLNGASYLPISIILPAQISLLALVSIILYLW